MGISDLIHKLVHFFHCDREERGDLSHCITVPGARGGELMHGNGYKTNSMIDNVKQHTLPSYHHISSRKEDF